MNIEEIISNGLDHAGGTLIKSALDRDLATLNCLNIIDTMMLELANSSKAIKGYKQNITFEANTNTGEIAETNLVLQDYFVRYRDEIDSCWKSIKVLDDLEDLTRAEINGKRAILFLGVNPIAYQLSFKPNKPINAEIWGKTVGAEIADLNDLPPFPKEFAVLCAYRLADFCLNQLLAIDAKQWTSFVIAQKGSIKGEREINEHIWRVYRANPASANTQSRVEEYDWREDYRESESEFHLFGRGW